MPKYKVCICYAVWTEEIVEAADRDEAVDNATTLRHCVSVSDPVEIVDIEYREGEAECLDGEDEDDDA